LTKGEPQAQQLYLSILQHIKNFFSSVSLFRATSKIFSLDRRRANNVHKKFRGG
jgi:hypothetical protein